MYSYTIFQWLIFFYLYCFFGWCWESSYVSVCEKKWVNRGFINGPALPLYGTGAIAMLIISAPYRDNIFLTYIAGFIGASLLELVTGIVMEKIFKFCYWDYSEHRFNFKGYICLSSSLFWGFLTVLMVNFAHKWIEKLVFLFPANAVMIASIAFSVIFIIDFAFSFKEAFTLRKILTTLDKLQSEMSKFQQKMRSALSIAQKTVKNEFSGAAEAAHQFTDKAGDFVENPAWKSKLNGAKEQIYGKTADFVEYQEWKKRFDGSREALEQFVSKVNPKKLRLLTTGVSIKSVSFKNAMFRLRHELFKSSKRRRNDFL